MRYDSTHEGFNLPVRWVVGPPLTASVKEVPAWAVLFGLDKRLPELFASPAVGVGQVPCFAIV